MAAYRDLVEQVLFEVDEMRHSIEYEAEGDPGATLFLEPMAAELKRLQDALATATYAFRDEDLPLVTCLERRYYEKLPFRYLVDLINATHRRGLGSNE